MRFIMERQSFWNKLQVYTFSSTYGGKKKANRFFFFLFFPYRKSKFSGFYKQLIFKRNCGVPVPSFDFFLQRIRFSPPSRVSILLQQNEASKCISLVFHLSSYFFFFLLPLLCIVTSIYNSLHLARLQMSFFFLSLDFCSSNICLLSVANGEQILLFCSVTKAFDILTSLLFDTVRIWEYNSVTDVCNFTTNFLFFVFFQTHRDLSTIQR